MAIILLDGFEMYSETFNNLTHVNLDDIYSPQGTNTFTSYITIGDMSSGNFLPGSIGSKCLISSSSTIVNNAMYYELDNITEVCVGLHFKVSSNNSTLFNLGNGPTWSSNRIGMAVSSSGLLSIFVRNATGTSGFYTSDVTPIVLNTWYYVELRVQVLGENVNAQAYKNGKLISTINNLPVLGANPTYQTINRMGFGVAPNSQTTASDVSYDNLYITDGEVLGPLYISPLLPSSDTVQKEWSSPTYTNYDKINETTGASLIEKVTSTTVGDKDYYEHNPIPLNDGIYEIKGLQDICVYSTDSFASTEFNVNINTGVSETTIDTILVPIGADVNKMIKFGSVLLNNPDTLLPFEISELNSTTIGLERTV